MVRWDVETNSWDEKSSANGHLHTETMVSRNNERNVKLVYDATVLSICEVPDAPSVPAFEEWLLELDCLK
jgi:hypothetical protein